LTTVTPYLEAQANITRTIRFTADSIDVMDGPFYFNDSTFDMMRIDYVVPLNSIEIWKLVNETMVAHPFHIHDVQFNILDRHGIPPGPEESGWKDVILVPPYDSARFITKFTDFTDTVVPYMFHCHILMHEDDGMMGQFVVSPFGLGIHEVNRSESMYVYPNPVYNSEITVRLKNVANEKVNYTISDLLGRETISKSVVTEKGLLKINLYGLSHGSYVLKVVSGSSSTVEKIMIE
jgi:bilirubin oxidase